MTVAQALMWAKRELIASNKTLRVGLESEILLAHVMGVTRQWLHTWGEKQVEEDQFKDFQELISKRISHIPIAYLIQSASFYSRDFYVDSSVLIPRPESELLIDNLDFYIREYNVARVAEIGVGSGVLSITLALKYPHLQIVATDISKDALEVASVNLERFSTIDSDLKKVGTTNKTGTTVRFMPDDAIFSTTTFSFTTICERMQESAFLIKGLTIDVIDEEDEKEAQFHDEKGLEEFVSDLNEGKKTRHNVVGFEGIKNKIEVDCAFQYTDSYNENVVSFVNNVKTSDGGSHEVGLKSALTKVFNDYAKNNGYLKAKDKNFEGSDVREGLTVILSLKIPEELLQFEGQTKGKLGTPLAKTVVEQVVYEKIGYFLEENKQVATDIINKALKGKAAREAARKAREEARKGKSKNSKEKNISDKLAPATKKNPKKNELFIVEGDSAGGSAKTGRDREYQAILPLRGKVLNTERCTVDEAYKNAEINTLIYTIGAGVGPDFHIEDCNYDKIIIMTDADDDGCHIQVLLITFFYRYMRPLIEAGKIYIANPPLYKVTFSKKDEVYVYTDEELKKVTEGKKVEDLQRYKGLGEMDANQLWDTTMDPLKRSLIKVKITDVALAEKRVSILMGDKVEPRKDWIEENVDFTLEDNYEMLK